jgi:hypothetical protein
MKKEVYFPDDRETRSALHAVKDEQKATGKSFSKIVNEALREHTERRQKWIQAKLLEYADEFAQKVEALHAELVDPNPKRYRTWKACLESEGLLTDQVIAYSMKKGWNVE